MLAQVVCEAFDVKPQLAGVGDQVFRSERVLVLEEQIVHFPESVLSCCGFCCLRGALCVGVDVAQRQVSPDVADVAEVL
jgi:hypothetical protein